jgi:hypothetical protein
MESPLSFNSSENFRKKLLVRNLPPYKVDGSFSTGDRPAVSEFRILDYAIVDSTSVDVIGDQQERLLYPINQYGPENKKEYGDIVKININRNYKTNEGEYGFPDTINSDLELIGDNSELYHIVKNVYKPQNNRKDYGDSVYYINDDLNIRTVGSGEYNISDTLNSYLFQIGNNSEIEHKVLNKYKPSSGTIGGFGDTKYEINDLLVLSSSFRQIFGYGISYTINSELEQVGNIQEEYLIVKNKYSPENSNQYGETRYDINADLTLGSNEGEYNYGDTIGDELELKGIELRPKLFTNNEYRPEDGQSVFVVEPYNILKNLIIGSGNYGYPDTIGSELEVEGKTDRPILIATNQYGPDNPIKGEVNINVNQQTNSNEGEYGFPDTIGSELENIGIDERKPTFLSNPWGPEGDQSTTEIDPYAKVKNLTINAGNYDVTDTDQNELEYVGGLKETEAYIKNKYVTGDGDYNLLTITDLQYQTTGLPYANSDSTFVFVPSTYSPASILISDNPNGSEGSLSQDSQLAALGAKQLQKEFRHRVALELLQQTLGRVNVLNTNIDADTGEISTKPNLDPFNALGLLTGNIPIIERNYSITSPELFLGQGINFAAKLAGTYSPYSYIPGDYFTYPDKNGFGTYDNVFSAIGGAIAGLIQMVNPNNNNSSELFLEHTTISTRHLLYDQLKYNNFRPDYKVGTDLTAPPGKFYVGTRKNEITEIVQGDQQPKGKNNKLNIGPVLGYGNIGKQYEGERISDRLFGLNTRNFFSSGFVNGSNKNNANVGISGGFTWLSNDNYVLPGDFQGPLNEKFQDNSDFEFSQLSSTYETTKSSNYEFTEGSLLDVTQKLVDAGSKSNNQLEHVGNAINQVSKVFNDGYIELTKGSRVIRYTTPNSKPDSTKSVQGYEYCRLFTKDRPYYTFDELQKTDGNIRKYTNSVLDNTYNLNIAPLNMVEGVESTNIIDGKVKKYMLSLENLAWRTSNKPGYTYEDLPACEKGPNGGRIMWFPPYDLSFDESTNTQWTDTTFIGRPEPVYTFGSSSRKGNLSFKIIVDHPSILNVLVEKELENESSQSQITRVIDSFFAGCTKYDLYDLVQKFPMFTPNDIFETQLILTPDQIKDYTETLPSSTIENRVDQTFIPPTETPQDNPCTEWDYSVGTGPTDLTYTACNGSQIVLPSLSAGTKGTVCVEKNTVPYFSVVAGNNTVTITNRPCTTSTTGTTPTPPEEIPLEKKYPEPLFYFHNDFPDPNTNRIYASKPYDQWLADYKALKTKYLSTGGSDGFRSFSKARDKIIKYGDSTYADKETEINGLSDADKNNFLANYIDTRTEKVSEFFEYIDSEFEEIKKFLTDVVQIIKQGGTVNFTLKSSASAVTTVAYNVNLSKRRIDAALQYILNFEQDGIKLKNYFNTKLIVKQVPEGETTTIQDPRYTAINCNKSYLSDSAEGVVSVNAMACRRVRILDVKVTNLPGNSENTPPNNTGTPTNGDGDTTVLNSETPSQGGNGGTPASSATTTTPTFITQTPSGQTENITPLNQTVTKNNPTYKTTTVARKDLTKRLARKLLTECNYFELVRQSDPMIYDGIKSKIKHFHPVFHSITPEGLNARLTFLNQCMRPGDTIPTVSKDNNGTETLLYNDVTNSVFGAPPVCVLRIGDFFHTKIVIDSLSLTYEDGRFDLNPEGIGVQPMIADVKIGFNFIGGHGLAGPIAKLQNALSFNYYANTEMYDERAEATEDVTSQYDAQILADIKNQLGIVNVAEQRPISNDGGVTIGTIKTNNYDLTTQSASGEISYMDNFKKLVDSTKSYASTTLQNLEKLNEELLLGGLIVLTKERKYTEGYFDYLGGNLTNTANIFGKSENTQQKIEKLITDAKTDVDNGNCPLLKDLTTQNFNDAEIRKIKNKIKSLIDGKQNSMITSIETTNSSITTEELSLIQLIDQINYVSSGVDGYINNKGGVVVYNLSGTSDVNASSVGVSNTFNELTQDFLKIKTEINEYYDKLYSFEIIPSGDTYTYNDNFTFDMFIEDNSANITAPKNRFFMLFGSDVLKDPVKFASSVTEPVKNTANDVGWNSYILKNIGWDFNLNLNTGQYTNQALPTGLYASYKKSKDKIDERFKKFKDQYYTNKFNTFNPFNKDKTRNLYYVTQSPLQPFADTNLKELWSETNSTWDKFNLKKSFS